MNAKKNYKNYLKWAKEPISTDVSTYSEWLLNERWKGRGALLFSMLLYTMIIHSFIKEVPGSGTAAISFVFFAYLFFEYGVQRITLVE